jgi:uncharacterized protein with GYD domain
MAKYLVQASYTAEGTKGLLKDGGSARQAAVKKATEGLGGKLESFYYAFGATDVFAIVEASDTVSAMALSLAVNATGAVRSTLTPLVSVQEVDAACKKTVGYRAPGA